MFLLLSASLSSMQPEATGATVEHGAGAPTGSAPAGCAGSGAGPQMLMLAVMFGVFYFLLIRPQQKRQREVDDMLKALRRGDKVRTSGGIRGEVLDLTDTEVTLLIADKVKINLLRSHIATRIGAGGEGAADDAKAKAAAG